MTGHNHHAFTAGLCALKRFQPFNLAHQRERLLVLAALVRDAVVVRQEPARHFQADAAGAAGDIGDPALQRADGRGGHAGITAVAAAVCSVCSDGAGTAQPYVGGRAG